MFCESCGGIGVPLDGMLFCNDCGEQMLGSELSQKTVGDDLGVNKSAVPNPSGSVFFPCPKCSHAKGERFEIPPQYGDEDSAFFTRCTNCGFAVKEEGSKNG